ncbi:RmlC-like jelly roll fold protein [Moelleriella libera RCEF 2490]|uniref:RmlC-like jelly roll fold protein n=1 Tax=Moelleriella libera RCEF 2490 TaxID=1081109 RepID=A0A162IU10_9HYPO|nr:RmlC-like jelly roll fold protein [Moelleriella libera RCEF 2490]
MASPFPDAARVISANSLTLSGDRNEPEVTNVREVVKSDEMFDGQLRRSVFGSVDVPAQNDRPLDEPSAAGSGIVRPGGINAYFLDLAPGFTTPMHRTVSTDFLLVHRGTATVITPEGPYNVFDGKADYASVTETTCTEGEVIIQRGQMHASFEQQD